MRPLLILFYFLFSTISVKIYGQAYPTGLNPPNIKWGKIENNKVQVIYPTSLESTAKNIGALISLLYDYPSYNLGPLKKKIPIILQNQTTISNGFVTVGPFRSEFFTTGPQYNFSGAASWMQLLAIHEYRHVHQFTNAQIGINWFASRLFGEYAWGVMAGLALPRWFFEGDAVFMETALTPSGRGRTPEFVNEYRAIFNERKIYGYEKASAGSFRDFVPDHYTLGYFLTTSIRHDYDSLTWSKIFSRAVKYQGIFYPFSRAMRKETGKRTPKMYSHTMRKIDSLWRQEDLTINTIDYPELLETKRRTFTSYSSPVKISDTELIFVKSSFNKINTLYSLNLKTKKEKKILEPGLYSNSNERFSSENQDIVWSRINFDRRWGNKDYSDILLYDTKKKQITYLTKNGRYFSPVLSPGGESIAAIYLDENRSVTLRILDKTTGKVIKSVRLIGWEDASFPVWQNDSTLIFVGKKENKNGFVRLDLNNEKQELISGMWTEQVGHLLSSGDTLLFTGTFTNRENIYAFLLNSGKLYQLTNSQFGARQPAVLGQKLYFSEFSSTGYKLSFIALDSTLWKEINVKFSPVYLVDNHSYSPINENYKIDTTKFSPQKFSYVFDPPKFHSAFYYVLPPLVGIQVFANNLSTNWSGTATYFYNQNEQKSSFLLSTEYAVFFPVFRLTAIKSERNRYTPVYIETITGDEKSGSLSVNTNEWDETSLIGSVVVPLNLSFGNYFSKLWWTNSLQYNSVNYFDTRLGTDEGFLSIGTMLSFAALKRKAIQHIHPRLGIQLDIDYQKTLGTNLNSSHSFQTEAKMYYPGLLRTHGGWISASLRREPFNSSYKFRDTFFYTRGIAAPLYDQIVRYSFNYSFPICYPDIPLLGPILFLKRIKANVFYDYSVSQIDPLLNTSVKSFTPVTLFGTFNYSPISYKSIGIELTTDSRLFRMLEIDMGVRYSHLPEFNSYSVEFILFSVAL